MENDGNEYIEIFEQRLGVDSPEVFGNFSVRNADYIILRLVESAKESVSLFTDRIPGEDGRLEEAVRVAAENIVKNNPKGATGAIRIITVDGEKHPGLVKSARETNAQLHRRVVSVIEAKHHGRKTINPYVVVDLRRYRLEDSHKPFKGEPPDILKSEVSCNNSTKAVVLESSFNRLWTSLKEKRNDTER